MPNWVFNTLTITGEKEDIKRVREQLNKPLKFLMEDSKWNEEKKEWGKETKEVSYPEPIFSFMNIIAPPDLEAYAKQPAHSGVSIEDPEWWSKTAEFAKTQFDWYNWNNNNWGTKWDVASADGDGNTRILEETETSISYAFDTAWSPPVPALEALSEQYPNLLLELVWEEEQGFGSTITFKNGESEESDQFNATCRECGEHTASDDIYREDMDSSACDSCYNNWLSKDKVSS